MEEIQFKHSKELDLIMNSCYDTASLSGDKEICLELLIYKVLHFYSSSEKGECKSLRKIIDELPMEKRTEIEKVCYDYYKKAARHSLTGYESPKEIPLSESLENSFKRAHVSIILRSKIGNRAETGEKETITVGDLLMFGVMFEEDNGLVRKLKEEYGLGKENLLANDITESLFGDVLKEKRVQSAEEQDEEDSKFEKAGEKSDVKVKKVDPNSKTPTLDQYGTDMTKKAKEGKYDPVIGREKEISQVIEILCCRKKNNAALLGDPGCGKTAVVEGLAQAISRGEVPREMKGKRIYSISTTDLQAGTIYRGQLEQRVQELCSEVTNNPDVIIFMDEFHTAVSEGSSNISQMLKPALGRGEVQMIVSTTNDEYRKFIEKDGALKRRFEPVRVDEPSVEDTVQILKGLSGTYSKFHQVKYTDEVLEKCVEWSGKYINDRFFPDKAIGVLDMASSLTKLENPRDYSKVDTLEKKIAGLDMAASKAIRESDFEGASKLRDQRKVVEKMLDKLKNPDSQDDTEWPVVGIDSVSKVISKTSGVPIDKIMSSDMAKVKAMKDSLSSRVIGQDEAITELSIALQRNILGLRDPHKPIASFLLVGPTGVGKTLVSKVLAEEFFGSEKSLVSISCSEYMQDWAESKLLGSAPGYVGFTDSEPRLYVLKRKPYSVLLIDEVEKSSNNLYNIWLNMLEEGEVTLSNGEKVSCRECIIIFTGNVGTKSLELHGNGIGFGKVSGTDKRKKDISVVMKEVEREFRPEFRNRLSKIIVFNSLSEDELKKIFDIELGKLQKRLKEQNGYELVVSDSLKEFIVSKCEPEYGARSLQRLIIEYVEQEICKTLLDNPNPEGKTIKLNKTGDSFVVEFS